jgi:hypothetical protein
MSAKQPSPAALRRRIDRLEQQVRAIDEARAKHAAAYGNLLADHVDLKIRVEQAIRILQRSQRSSR